MIASKQPSEIDIIDQIIAMTMTGSLTQNLMIINIIIIWLSVITSTPSLVEHTAKEVTKSMQQVPLILLNSKIQVQENQVFYAST